MKWYSTVCGNKLHDLCLVRAINEKDAFEKLKPIVQQEKIDIEDLCERTYNRKSAVQKVIIDISLGKIHPRQPVSGVYIVPD